MCAPSGAFVQCAEYAAPGAAWAKLKSIMLVRFEYLERIIFIAGLSIRARKHGASKTWFYVGLTRTLLILLTGKLAPHKAPLSNTILNRRIPHKSEPKRAREPTTMLHSVFAFMCYFTYNRVSKAGTSWKTVALLWSTHCRNWPSMVCTNAAALIDQSVASKIPRGFGPKNVVKNHFAVYRALF